MKIKTYIGGMAIATVSALLTTSCDDYLNNLPKGKKVPTELTDFSAMIADEYNCQRVPVTQAVILLNDSYVTPANLNYYPLWKANYNWDTTIDRVKENKSDESTYYTTYGAISTANLILENVETATGGTDTDRKVLAAQARMLRAESYFVLLNYYAKNYNASTAATDGGVPLITSAEVGAAYTQPSVQQVYDFVVDDVTKALPDLPQKSANVLYADRATGYAFAARLYLQMGFYEQALTFADQALALNDKLFDWTAFYAQHKDVIEKEGSYQNITSPMGYDYVENYDFRHGESSYSDKDSHVTIERAKAFEEGDASFLSRWKLRTVGSETYYQALFTGMNNKGGITTTEVYLIKAECMARTGDVSGAVAIINKVRRARILADKYQDFTTTSAAEAIRKIRQVKGNALIQTQTPFCDARRLNQEPDYAVTLTKTIDGKTVGLAPDAYMWTMPFPQGAVSNAGNGTVTQNVEK